LHALSLHASAAYDQSAVDLEVVRGAVAAQSRRATPGIEDMESYLAQQVGDTSHREVLGPLRPGTGASGVVVHRGWVIGQWGDPSVPEMCFSATKTVVSMVAGLAFDDGRLSMDAPVTETVDHPLIADAEAHGISWQHLLQQTSQWDGELWGKPTRIDEQSRREGTEPEGDEPGSGWAYNDVRVNLLCLALTVLLRRPLPAVLGERLLDPLGGSSSWSWSGYMNSIVACGSEDVAVVSGGAHWGGGLSMSANDLALLGELYLRRGTFSGRSLLSEEWIEASWRPCDVKPEYGYLWWLNDTGRVFPAAPASGRCARGNGGRHLLWVDPDRDLVIASHWGDEIEQLLAAVSAAVPATNR
jgi:CubicO group peptidase (beta-lactamase class C family)